ncbi:hypothetical protein [Paenibacillus sp. y28]|uniref:hypothetical protein n=1 Tax=Paenibacillus sp. y28 TaxID=3129110 RepID=UPI00301ABD9A
MLKQALQQKQFLLQEELIKYYMAASGQKEVTGLVICTRQPNENYLGLYRTRKDQYGNALEAFITLWTRGLADKEGWAVYSEFDEELLHHLFHYWLLKDVDRYTFPHTPGPLPLRDHIMKKIARLKGHLTAGRVQQASEAAVAEEYDGIPGIYIDRQRADEQVFHFMIPAPLYGEQLFSIPSRAGYKGIFLETDQEYIYFDE